MTTPDAIEATHTLFHQALLAISTGCAVLLSHGSPGKCLTSLAALDRIALPADEDEQAMLQGALFAYGQFSETTERM